LSIIIIIIIKKAKGRYLVEKYERLLNYFVILLQKEIRVNQTFRTFKVKRVKTTRARATDNTERQQTGNPTANTLSEAQTKTKEARSKKQKRTAASTS